MRRLKLSLFCCCSKDKKGKKTTIVPLLNQNGNAGKIGQCLNPLISFWLKKMTHIAKNSFRAIIWNYFVASKKLGDNVIFFTFSEELYFIQVWKKIFKIVGKQKIGVVKGEKISKAIYDFLSSPKKRTKKWKNLTWEPFVLFFWENHKLILRFSNL